MAEGDTFAIEAPVQKRAELAGPLSHRGAPADAPSLEAEARSLAHEKGPRREPRPPVG